MIVVDANILAFYLIEGKRTQEAHALRKYDAEWLVPSFWSIEFQSILWKYMRFNGMPEEDALVLMKTALSLFSANELTPSPIAVLKDATQWGITVYDAQYVSLAKQFGVHCITEDGPLQEKCPEIALSIDSYIKQSGNGKLLRESKATYRTRRKKRPPPQLET
ncbi:MAG: type II toxin-antitoxin system VapC family toxin [Lentisphaerota bacterium]